jgi:hypothetical protein
VRVLKGISIKETAEYVSVADKSDNPTKFLIGNIPHEKKLEIMTDMIQPDGKIDMSKMPSKYVQLFKAGVKGIKNFDGKDYVAADLTDELIESIPLGILAEVASKVMASNFVNEGEAKN